MFRHYRVILREFVINTLPSYTNISNAAVGNTIYIKMLRGPTGKTLQQLQKHQAKVTEINAAIPLNKICKGNILIVNCITNSCI